MCLLSVGVALIRHDATESSCRPAGDHQRRRLGTGSKATERPKATDHESDRDSGDDSGDD
jgi:hypothetical protein